MLRPNNSLRKLFSHADRYRIVWFLGWAAIITNTVMVSFKLIFSAISKESLSLFALFIITLFVTMVFIKRRFKYAIQIFFIVIMCLMAAILYQLGDINTPATAIFLMVIIIMGLLEGARGAINSTIASFLAISIVQFTLHGGGSFSGETGAVWFSYSLTMVFAGFLVYAISELFEKNLTSLHKFSNIVTQTPLSVVVFSLDGKVDYVNKAFTKVTGFSYDEALTINAHDFINSVMSKDQATEFWNTLRAGKIWEGEIISHTKQGDHYFEKLIVKPLFDSNDTNRRFVAINENINDRKTAELTLQKAHSELQDKLSEILQLKNALQEQTMHDPLTGLYNRRFLTEVIERELHRAERKQTKLSLIILDIDHFKKVNDQFGHQVGDEALRLLSNFLLSNVRKMDLVCRYGGEEFVVVMPEASINDAKSRAEALRKGISDMIMRVENEEISITCSFGYCEYPTLAANVDQLLSRADIALYASKQAGRDRCTQWESHMNMRSLQLTH